MAWLTPEEFEMAVKIERTEGRAGFGALLAAAVHSRSHKQTLDVFSEWWYNSLNEYHWAAGADIANEYAGQRFTVFFAAAALHADLDNQRKIEQICPGLNEELSIRYNTAGSLIPGEKRVMDGKLYKCVEVLSEGFGKYMVVEVANG